MDDLQNADTAFCQQSEDLKKNFQYSQQVRNLQKLSANSASSMV